MNNPTLLIIGLLGSALVGSASALAVNQFAAPAVTGPTAQKIAAAPETCARLEKLAASWGNPFAALQAERLHERIGCDPRGLAQSIKG